MLINASECNPAWNQVISVDLTIINFTTHILISSKERSIERNATDAMSKTMAAHEPINYLDSILNEEEKRCEYSHQWRNFTISRSGRFKSKNKHRNVVDGKMFDRTSSSSTSSASASSTSGTVSSSSSSSKLSSLSSTSCYDKDKVCRLSDF